MNLSVLPSMAAPKWPQAMPTKSTKVAPSDTPKTFTFPSITPMAITKE